MNKYLLCNKATGKTIMEKYGEDFQHSEDGLHDYITDSLDGDSNILWSWSHDSYLVGAIYDVEIPDEEEKIIFTKKG